MTEIIENTETSGGRMGRAIEFRYSSLKALLLLAIICALAYGLFLWTSPETILNMALEPDAPTSRQKLIDAVKNMEDAERVSFKFRVMTVFPLLLAIPLVLKGMVFKRAFFTTDYGTGEVVFVANKIFGVSNAFRNQQPKLEYRGGKLYFEPPITLDNSTKIDSFHYSQLVSKDSTKTIQKKIQDYNQSI